MVNFINVTKLIKVACLLDWKLWAKFYWREEWAQVSHSLKLLGSQPRISKGLKNTDILEGRVINFGISEGKGGGGGKMFMSPVVGYGYFPESPINTASTSSIPIFFYLLIQPLLLVGSMLNYLYPKQTNDYSILCYPNRQIKITIWYKLFTWYCYHGPSSG